MAMNKHLNKQYTIKTEDWPRVKRVPGTIKRVSWADGKEVIKDAKIKERTLVV